ncbi:AbiH family protein [uncultured Kordia sp.]|uniref:AbiH family protein n=1 Tax=uncultured Kordia sp. TaxID=507699 RepID=UPI00262B6605|nr:AbiH family protein [uncultured Kordia sp.]
MNRIILIGNGFDLAHGMKTSYNDFLKYFWKKTITEVHKFEGKEIFENEDIIVRNVPLQWLPGYEYSNLKKTLKAAKSKIEFKNIFLEKISEKAYIQNWVDIENEYYELLKQSFDKRLSSSYYIQQLNSDFERVKDLLEEYLLKIELEFDKSEHANFSRTRHRIQQRIYSSFKLKDFSENSQNIKIDAEYADFLKDAVPFGKGDIDRDDLSEKRLALIQTIGADADKEKFKKLILSQDADKFFDLIPNHTLFLNFNYTFTELHYEFPFHKSEWKNGKIAEFIHIHGSNRKEDNNPIIFGFGDELDEDYKRIEKLNDNDYLENIKSIRYLDTDNYKRLLEFVNSGKYQIMIMGHSCGTSDRTLLNTVFENENCASIKTYYHNKGDSKDNFSDIIKNISRNFNDKALMRDKVVNKTYCEPLN